MIDLPDEIIYEILSYCSSYQDYQNWNLVSFRWHNLMVGAIRNMLTHDLYNIIDQVLPGNDNYTFKYLVSDPGELRFGSINTFFFIEWRSPRITRIKFFHEKELSTWSVDKQTWKYDHPYWFGTQLPDDGGYICTKFIGDINRIAFMFKPGEFTPFLIATK